MEQMQIAVAWLLRIGMCIALLLVGIGGIIYLCQHANDAIHYQSFHGAAFEATSIKQILSAVPTLTPRAIMQMGVLVLILTQILRIAMVAWYFTKMSDYKFTAISVFVLLVVIAATLGIVTWQLP